MPRNLTVGMMVAALLILGTGGSAGADGGGVVFTDIAAGDGAGISYRRAPSASEAIAEQLRQQSLTTPLTFEDWALFPNKGRGAPGVAVFDFDRDGDLDIYVTNGPGAPNSLYSNQLREVGETTFVDVAAVAGVEATDQDSTGVVFGDLDNDGDHDLFVLGNGEPNRLFENLGDGTFVDITAASGLGGGDLAAMSAAFGDIDGDGLLDVYVGNNPNMDNSLAFIGPPEFQFSLSVHNQLYLNLGDNTFEDVSASSGIRDLNLPAPAPADAAGQTWAVAMVDIDQDGDVDIFSGDDQAAFPPAAEGGIDGGYAQLFLNDGSGQFTNVTRQVGGVSVPSSWMGFNFGDFDSDGNLDLLGTQFGVYEIQRLFPGIPLPALARSQTAWVLGQDDGSFVFADVGDLVATPFGWGTSTIDYDNDGDQDIVWNGNYILRDILLADNPGVIYQNDGQAGFSNDSAARASVGHSRRAVHGLAVGDLNEDGFVDLVTVSSADAPEPIPLELMPSWGSPFDSTSFVVRLFDPVGPGQFAWNGTQLVDGTLAVEINSADNGNRWLAVEVLGTIGLTSSGSVNRDGIGAVVRFQPKRGKPVLQPILGGSSYASQDSLSAGFGLGRAPKGTVDVLWPGGVRNRLYNARHGETLRFPEIPCTIEARAWASFREYYGCVSRALYELGDAEILSRRERKRFLRSALFAFFDR